MKLSQCSHGWMGRKPSRAAQDTTQIRWDNLARHSRLSLAKAPSLKKAVEMFAEVSFSRLAGVQNRAFKAHYLPY